MSIQTGEVSGHARRSVAAVIVAYEPDANTLREVLAAIEPQVHRVYVIDNTPADRKPTADYSDSRIEHLRLGVNVGVAAAQNRGFAAAFSSDIDFVLLLDQDSVAQSEMVERLLQTHFEACVAGMQVAAVGPLVPGRHEDGGFVRFGWFRHEVITCAPVGWTQCDVLIASGSLISRQAYEAIGPMDEMLFIDKVDTDWCLRAASRGFSLIGNFHVRLSHQLGDNDRALLPGLRKRVAMHKPFRYYYIVRNTIRLMCRPWSTWRYRTAEMRRLLLGVPFFVARSDAPFTTASMCFRGLTDALRGRLGPKS